MNETFQRNVAAAGAAAQSTVLNDLGALSGINPAYAQAYPALLGGYMAAKATGGGQATPLDTYAMGVVGGLAALVTTDPRQAAACFEDIAAWAIGGAAHCRTALDAEKQAQDAQAAAGAAPDAPAPVPATGGPSAAKDDLARKLRDAANRACTAQVQDQKAMALARDTAPMPQAVPEDPRERAGDAYAASADEAPDPKI